jgi:hypothetical protein
MFSPRLMSLMRHVRFLGCAVIFSAGIANAQSAPVQDQSVATGYSSSQAGLSESGLQLTEFSLPDSPGFGAATPADGSSAAGQYGNGGGYGGGGSKHAMLHNWAFEAGGGFNAPISSSVTYGGNVTVGAGLNFSKYIAGLIEYQFIDDKLPGALIAETGANGGYAHMWSFTFDPVIDLTPKATNGVYITGGGGFYRKVTNFTDPEEAEYCEYYGCGIVTENEVVGHFSSNQGGINIGGGFEHRVGGDYGDSHTKIFVEARYLELFSPASVTNPNGLGTTAVTADTKVIPITFGVRF